MNSLFGVRQLLNLSVFDISNVIRHPFDVETTTRDFDYPGIVLFFRCRV